MILRKRILVCDDDSTLLYSMVSALEEWGWEVVSVEDGRRAEDLIRNQTFDLFIFDLLLPSVSGFELIYLLRQSLHLKVPIIVISEMRTDYLVGKVRELGVDLYLKKPIQVRELVDEAQSFLK